ncbi:unannotated protein [freshwater metagenome]|uniref:Unannotated protein n=1 Tax=freshwater metagenome TaxID=449393 RepID=A0A6J6FPX5_9ZZZZ
MPKNWVVSANPEAPYQSPRPLPLVFTRKAPRSCLSKPMAIPRSYTPERMVLYAEKSAEPPVAQPLATLMNCRPVRPSNDTIVSAAPAAIDPPKANWMSSQLTPASAHARRTATTPWSMPDTPSVRPNSCMPIPTMATSVVMCAPSPVSSTQATGANAKVTISFPSASVESGTMTISISIPILNFSGSASVRRASIFN